MTTTELKDIIDQFKDTEFNYTRYYVKSNGSVVKVTGPFEESLKDFNDVCAKLLINEDSGKRYYYAKFAGSNLFDPKEKYRNRKIHFQIVTQDKFQVYAMFLETKKEYLLAKAERL